MKKQLQWLQHIRWKRRSIKLSWLLSDPWSVPVHKHDLPFISFKLLDYYFCDKVQKFFICCCFFQLQTAEDGLKSELWSDQQRCRFIIKSVSHLHQDMRYLKLSLISAWSSLISTLCSFLCPATLPLFWFLLRRKARRKFWQTVSFCVVKSALIKHIGSYLKM